MRFRSAALALVCAGLSGCAAERTLRITTTPPGATVRLDDETLGQTPLKVPFYYYGIRRITVVKAGYHTQSEVIELDPPWWSRFPIDFVTEVLLPFGWKDKRRYHVDLEEGSEVMSDVSLYSVIERASVLRHAGPEGPRDLPAPQPVELPAEKGEPEDDQP